MYTPLEYSELRQVVLAEEERPLTDGQLDLLLRATEALTDAWVAGEPDALAVPASREAREERATLRYPFPADPEGRHHVDPQAAARFVKAAQDDG